MKKLTLVILGLGCLLLTGCGAHLHRQNQGIATIKEGSVREATLSSKTPVVDLDIQIPLKVQYRRMDIDKEFTYAKKNLSPELFKEFKQRMEQEISRISPFWLRGKAGVHWQTSWRSCKIQSFTGMKPVLSALGVPLIFDAFLIPTQMFTSAGCGTIERALFLEEHMSKFIDVEVQRTPQLIILKCKRAKCRIEDENGNLVRTTPVITVQMVKNPQGEKSLVEEIKEEARRAAEKEKRQAAEEKRQAAEKRRKERRERAAEAERRAEEVRRHGGKMGYCLYIYKQVDELWSYPHLIQSAREIMLLSDYRALSCGSVLSIDL